MMQPQRASCTRNRPDLPPLAETALLLDLDGTLLDIAPTPDAVVVPPGLLSALTRVRGALCDALAVISGRPIAQVDALLADAPFAVAGEHGGAIRHAPDAPIARPPLPAPPQSWITRAGQLAMLHPGVQLERKERGFVLHYRAAPEAGPSLQAALERIVVEQDQAFQLVAAHMAWEVRPRGADKGTAVVTLLQLPPFLGRRPVFIGDDVTDQDGMRAARDAGGAGLFVPEVFGDAAGVRAWLAALADAAERGQWPGW